MFRLTWEWLDAPQVPVGSHARTWARFEIGIGETCATHVEDRRTTSVRDAIYIPLMPLAEWIAANWWYLVSEGAGEGEMIGARAEMKARRWYSRHNLLFAREGDPLPDFTLSVADDDIALLQLVPDLPWPDRQYPVRFTEQATTRVALKTVRDQLSKLVDATVERLHSCFDADARELKEQWAAIRNMTGEDRLLRQRAAALGLDGDDPEAVDDEFANELVQGLASFPPGLVNDLLAAPTTLAGIRRRAAGVTEARASRIPEGTSRQLATARDSTVTPQDPLAPPHTTGWGMAKHFREQVLGCNVDCVADSLDAAVEDSAVTRVSSKIDFRDDFVRGWVAANANGVATVALPPTRGTTARFLRARGVALALLGKRERLITNAATHAQSISRAFATELLAPAETVRDLLRGRTATWDVIDEIASVLNVRPQVVIHQIQNHSISYVTE